MESIRMTYKSDDHGNPLEASVCWPKDSRVAALPIALVYHAGGLMVGSSEMIPKSQLDYLCSHGFVCLVPNYRLAPQVTAKEAYADCVTAYDWAVADFPASMESEHGIQVNTSKIVAMGHSAGGTLAMHLASCRPVKAVTAFYPSLFVADTTTSIHEPTSVPPFGMMPDFEPSEDDWKSISPAGKQLSEASLALPGTPPSPRSRWQMSVLKNGKWGSTVQPDGDYKALDPLTRLNASWPPVMIVQGEVDNLPGSSLELGKRAEKEMVAAGLKEVKLVSVPEASHMFDMSPTLGTSDLGPKWQAVIGGLDWLCDHL